MFETEAAEKSVDANEEFRDLFDGSQYDKFRYRRMACCQRHWTFSKVDARNGSSSFEAKRSRHKYEGCFLVPVILYLLLELKSQYPAKVTCVAGALKKQRTLADVASKVCSFVRSLSSVGSQSFNSVL